MASNNPNGRPKGSPNKQSVMLQEYIVEKGNGVSPGKVMLDEMWFHYSLAGKEMVKPDRSDKLVASHLRNASIPAEKVAPFVHTRLAAVTVSGDGDNPLVHDHTVRQAPAKLTKEQLEAMSEDDLVRLYRATVSASNGDRGEPGNPHPAGNGKMPT